MVNYRVKCTRQIKTSILDLASNFQIEYRWELVEFLFGWNFIIFVPRHSSIHTHSTLLFVFSLLLYCSYSTKLPPEPFSPTTHLAQSMFSSFSVSKFQATFSNSAISMHFYARTRVKPYFRYRAELLENVSSGRYGWKGDLHSSINVKQICKWVRHDLKIVL